MATFKFNPSENTSPNKIPSTTDQKSKARVPQIFKPTVTLDELSIRAEEKNTKEFSGDQTAAVEFPIVKINDYVAQKNEIDDLIIDCTGFIPKLTLTLTFANDIFYSKEFPKDGDIISIAIRNKSDLINMIRNDYVIKGTVSDTVNTTVGKQLKSVTFFGELFVPGLSTSYNYSKPGSTYDVLQEIAKYLQLGFCSNEIQTDDKQVWMSYSTPMEFIQNLVSRSWKDDNSFFDIWIDPYYNLNFVNVNKQLISDENEVDIGALLSNINSEWIYGGATDQNKVKSTAKVFSNINAFRTTSFYIKTWTPINRSTAITFEFGTGFDLSFFEHNQKLYSDNNSTKYWNFLVEPIYDKDKIKNHIILRGRTSYDASTNSDQLARANYNYNDIYKRSIWLGIQYTISNPDDDPSEWDGNHHRNYLRSYPHNVINLKELDKLNLELSVNGLNLNVLKGDKIPVAIIQKDMIENKLKFKKEIDSAVDAFYSGWYYVKGFNIDYHRDENLDSGLSSFGTEFILTRREWPTPIPIEPLK